MPTLLSIGHGYSAAELARLLLPQGWRIIGTTRSAEKAERLQANGVEPVIWPGADLSTALGEATHVLSSVAPVYGKDPVIGVLADGITREAKRLIWVGYLSTTGVYGDHGSDWVDEGTALTSQTKRGQARIAAEAAWQDLAMRSDLPLHIFRLGGIYGPGRGPFAKIRAGTARRIVKPGQVFSRIHVEDIAAVLAASIKRPNPGAIYNVCDDEPAPPEDVIGYAAQLLDMPVPPTESWDQADMTPMARSFYAESKRVRNTKIKEELGVKLCYPNYRKGLEALLKEEQA